MNQKLKEMKDKFRIYVPEDKLRDLVHAVYDLSPPVGMGVANYLPGPLDETSVGIIVDNPRGIHMDYVNGRRCKMTVYKEDNQFYILKNWSDHTHSDMKKLLERINITHPEFQ